MNTEKKKLITAEGLKGLSEELEYLKVVRRKEIAEKIKDARDQGDLTENAEYDAAKDEQREIEARIEEIESLIKNAEVVAQGRGKPRKVNVGCSVT
ncbi:MAG: transcription elongation factor GreA, partial [Lachnospiraceae bacterium]|nr:transcription elongation factor GreA [Lachnospiraceae bacterium]